MPIDYGVAVAPQAAATGTQAPAVNGTQAPAPAPTATLTVAQATVVPPNGTRSSTLEEDLAGAEAAKKQKEETKKMIGRIIKDHVFRLTKFIRFEGAEAIAAAEVLTHCNYQQLTQGTKEQKDHFKGLWISTYKQMVASCLNTRRSDVTQALRKLFKAKFSGPGRQLPPPDVFEAILQRSFGPEQAEMYELFQWWWDQVIPKVAGADWDKDKRYYGLMSSHHYKKKLDKLYVPVSTEALAV